jgi:hypothetical protein
MRSTRSTPIARLASVAIALALSGLAGCVTPSIPIPPPEPTLMTFSLQLDQNGMATSASLEYPATENYKGGIAYVYNRSLGVGIIQNVNADGSIGPTTPVAAQVGNSLVISVENDDHTVSTCVLLREGSPSSVCQ